MKSCEEYEFELGWVLVGRGQQQQRWLQIRYDDKEGSDADGNMGTRIKTRQVTIGVDSHWMKMKRTHIDYALQEGGTDDVVLPLGWVVKAKRYCLHAIVNVVTYLREVVLLLV